MLAKVANAVSTIISMAWSVCVFSTVITNYMYYLNNALFLLACCNHHRHISNTSKHNNSKELTRTRFS